MPSYDRLPTVAEISRGFSRRKIFLLALVVGLVLAVLLVYGAELAAEMTAHPGKPEFVAARREADPRVVPAVTPQIVLTETRSQGLGDGPVGLVPLGGVSKRPTVFCREEGEYLEYVSDRYGFHNPDEVWDAKPLDVALIGDSFVQGACVPPDRNFAGVLRKTFGSVLNLGSFGNGPLGDLATMREYLPALRPRRVVLFYVSNDLGVDLAIERSSPVMQRYLVPGFSQHLRERQPEIDAALEPFLAQRLDGELTEARDAGGRVTRFLTLAELRRRLRVERDARLRPPPPTVPASADYDRFRSLDLRMFDRVIVEARSLALSWGGELTVVIVPDARMFGGYAPAPYGIAPDLYVGNLVVRLRNLGVGVVNLHETFAAQPNPLALYAAMGGYYGHFNVAGYELAAETVARALAAR